MFFHPKNLKSENNNTWFKPWFNILLHTQSIVCATVDSQCLEYLGYINLVQSRFSRKRSTASSKSKLMIVTFVSIHNMMWNEGFFQVAYRSFCIYGTMGWNSFIWSTIVIFMNRTLFSWYVPKYRIEIFLKIRMLLKNLIP